MLQFIFTILSNRASIEQPFELKGWLYVFLLLAFVMWALWKTWTPISGLDRRKAIILLLLTLLAPLVSSFFGVRVLNGLPPPFPGLPVDVEAPLVMIFSAIPWVLAAGFLSPPLAAIIALLGAFPRVFFETHSLFTGFELMLLALIYSVCIRQRYRSSFFSLLRHPFFAAFASIIVLVPYYALGGFFAADGDFATMFGFSIIQPWGWVIPRFLEVLVASFLAEVLFLKGAWWKVPRFLQPSPVEQSIKGKFYFGVVPLALGLMLILAVGNWFFAQRIARLIVRDRLSTLAIMASESLPAFIEMGQYFIKDVISEEVTLLPEDQMQTALLKGAEDVPYFDQLIIFDARGNFVAGYPTDVLDQAPLTLEEQSGVRFAFQGVPMQLYVLPPVSGDAATRLSFISLIMGEQGNIYGVIVGRAGVVSNPFSQSFLGTINAVEGWGGGGAVVDQNSQVVFRSKSYVETHFAGSETSASEDFHEEMSPSGDRYLVFRRMVKGTSWAIILCVPFEKVQEIALMLALPIMLVIIVLIVFIVLLWSFVLGRITSSLRELAKEATYVSSGQLDRSIPVYGADEVGQLSYSFEQMRMSLKARIEELSRLLVVSQSVASHLDARSSLQPVFEAILDEGADIARIVLESSVMPDSVASRVTALGAGRHTDQYAYLDEQVFDLMAQQDTLIIPNTVRMRRIQFLEGRALGALMAIALRSESHYYGVLWLAYYDQHNFTDGEIRFFNTLATHASLAVANARLYSSAEIGRRRLEAVLASTPDPVLVIDEQMQLLLLNPAALQIPDLIRSPQIGKPINEVVIVPALLDLLAKPVADTLTTNEITLSQGKIFNACISPVISENRLQGKICILRDVTHYKELDTIKSEFVSTVSHDLRSPLSLMRGYATMLQMVGELNAQQKGYLGKIIQGIDNMIHLVNNLLDLGRIEAGVGLRVERISGIKIIENVINLLQPQATQKKIQLQFVDNNSSLAILEADPALLQQALYNLVENAIQYTQVGGQVTASLEVRPSSVVFTVKDTGIGIAPLDLPHIFEKFYRSEGREAHQARGTGLGLAIVKSIAERHKGHVWVESQLGKGSAFSLELPFKQTQSL
ncbi:MAG: HAMP domain-containing protein [Anaerolineae bacterium]|nr:HAMP domain-containing protein [Anaerolineae bacterium]